MPQPPKERVYQGTPVSRGIVFGPVHIAVRGGFTAPEVHSITEDAVGREEQRFHEALSRTKVQLDQLRTQIESISGSNEDARVFEAHLMVLEDSVLLNKVSASIQDRLQNAEYCFYAVMQTYLEAMRRIPDPYLRERTVDIEDVCQRVLRNFDPDESSEADTPTEEHVLVAYDVTPSDTMAMERQNVLGFATEQGSPNSHSAILARSLGIPAVVGLQNAVFNLHALSPCILDGYEGKLIVHPTEETRAHYEKRQAEKQAQATELEQIREAESVTKDGHRITLSANIEFDYELDQVISSGAEGVGLFRTEFFLLDKPETPTEEEQTEMYSNVAQRLAPNPVIFRTLDAGGDKLPGEPLTTPEPNPFLGWRGIRFSLSRQDIFKEQLRAILRAGVHGNVGVMFPLVTGVSEVRQAKKLLATCIKELEERGEKFEPNIDVGVMIEVPSAAVVAGRIAKEVDFLSIGTNDLIQYTCAVDRINPKVSNLYQPTHPGVIALIDSTVRGGNEAGIWTGLCGEMAADVRFLPLVLGLGVSELSVTTQLLPVVKQAVRSLNYEECRELAQLALADSTSAEVLARTVKMAEEAYPELL